MELASLFVGERAINEECQWTDLEKFVLIRSPREILPELAAVMGRPLKDVVAKYFQLHEIHEISSEEENS